jgi:hypothetical protein
MNERNIVNLISSLRNWCYEILEDGPVWSRPDAMRIINKINSINIREELEENSWGQLWSEICTIVRNDLVSTLRKRVLYLALDTGKRAPPGWHGLLLRSKEYRTRFSGSPTRFG